MDISTTLLEMPSLSAFFMVWHPQIAIYFRCFCRKAKQFAKKANSTYLLTQLHVFYTMHCRKTQAKLYFYEKFDSISMSFHVKKGGTLFSYQFWPFGYFENFDGISMSFRVKKGGKLFSYEFCPFGYSENFDSISMLKKA